MASGTRYWGIGSFLNDQSSSELSYELEIKVVLDFEGRILRGCWRPGPLGVSFLGVSEEDWPLRVSDPTGQMRPQALPT